MAEVTKYELISNTTTNNNNNNSSSSIFSDLRGHFSLLRTRKSSSFVYGVVFFFVCFTIFLAFSSSSSSSSSTSPWFINVFTVNTTSPPIPTADESSRSHFNSVYSYFFPNSTAQISPINSARSQTNSTFEPPSNDSHPTSQNLNNTQVLPDKAPNFAQKNSTIVSPVNQNNQTSPISESVTISAPASAPQSSGVPENSTVVGEQQPSDQSSVGSDQIDSSQKNQTSEVSHSGQQNATIIQPEKQTNQSSQVPQQIDATSSGDNTGKQEDKISGTNPPQTAPVPPNSPSVPSNSTMKESGIEVKSTDFAATLSKNKERTHANDSVSGGTKQQGSEVEQLVDCDLYDGGWVRDNSYPLYKPGSCKFIDEQFNCVLNGRPDHDYQKLKWKPKGCALPRLKGDHMLKLLKGKRLVFVGDSLNRNMWESLVCILKNSVKNKKHVYEAFGRHSFRTEASYSFVFKDYNCTVEFFVSPFLVQQWEVTEKDGSIKETLRLDLMVRDADQFKNADFLIFNTGHWWTHDKTSKGEDYYQEGSHVYKQLDVDEAFRRATTTWARWVDANVNPQRTHVMFRGYSASHFSGGQWNSGGKCDNETEPIRDDKYLTEYPLRMKVLESVIKGMKLPVSYLNVTRLTDYRKDGHPSVYRKLHPQGDEKVRPLKYQDCSHWCLPGVPDSWNELLYAELLRKQYQDQRQQNKT